MSEVDIYQERQGAARVQAVVALALAGGAGGIEIEAGDSIEQIGREPQVLNWSMTVSGVSLDVAQQIEALGPQGEAPHVEVTHGCPPMLGGGGLTPCCGRSPLELPVTDRLSLDPRAVNCTAPTAVRP